MTSPDRQSSRLLAAEQRPKSPLSRRLIAGIARRTLELTARSQGIKQSEMPGLVMGLCEGAVLANRVYHPCPEANGEIMVHEAGAGEYHAYDFLRARFFPETASRWPSPPEGDGILMAFIPDGIVDQLEDERTELTYVEWFDPDLVFSLDRPGVVKLCELGMLARRTHEEAYERVGASQWIGDLRARSVADKPLYQVTPKGHTLIKLTPDGGDTAPKQKRQFAIDKVPGIFAH